MSVAIRAGLQSAPDNGPETVNTDSGAKVAAPGDDELVGPRSDQASSAMFVDTLNSGR